MADIKYAMDLISQDIIFYLMKDENYTMEEALDALLHSVFYEKLYDPETGLYFQSSDYNYELFCNEIKTGKLQ